MQKNKLKIFCDGGARGNPGPAGIGVVVVEPKGLKKSYKKFVGVKTNNQAEYEAVLFALKIAKNYKNVAELDIYLDSLLVVKQMKGEYKIKNEALGSLLIKIRNEIIKRGIKVDFKHIKRSKNFLADKLVNEAIDKETHAQF